MTGHIFSCRSCHEKTVDLILSLGMMPLANSFLSFGQLEQKEPFFPLDLVFCTNCSLVQITETVSPKTLFENYLYFSSYSDTMLFHSKQLVDEVIEQRHIVGDSLIMEIASNDGYLLQYYKNRGIPVLGIEPARNVAELAEKERGVPTLHEFFSRDLARKLVEQKNTADVIHANNVLAHVADLNDFVSGIQLLMKDEGIAIIEVPYVKDLIEHCAFDTIYHEHLCYFSLTALASLFTRHNLVIQRVEQIPIHGGSLRLFVSIDSQSSQGDSVQNLLAEERSKGLDNFKYFLSFAHQVEAAQRTLRKLLIGLKKGGKRVAAYGAAAKGTVLLNYLAMEEGTIDFVVDRSPIKQGLYMPGVHLPIYAPEKLIEEKPDYVLLLSWNLADEILTQQSEYRERGGKFIIPSHEPIIL